MNITSRNLNRIINGYITSISFKYIEEFCKYLNWAPGELIEIINEKKLTIKVNSNLLHLSIHYN